MAVMAEANLKKSFVEHSLDRSIGPKRLKWQACDFGDVTKVLWRRDGDSMSTPDWGHSMCKFDFSPLHKGRVMNQWGSDFAGVAAWCKCVKLNDMGCRVCLGNFLLRCPLHKIPPEELKHMRCVAKEAKDVPLHLALVSSGLKPVASIFPSNGNRFRSLVAQHEQAYGVQLELVVKATEAADSELDLDTLYGDEVYVLKSELADKPVSSLFRCPELLGQLYDMVERYHSEHLDGSRERTFLSVLPHEPVPLEGVSLGSAVVKFAHETSVRKALARYDLANQSSRQWNLYNEWKDRKNIKFTDWWRRMEREERFEHGFLFSPYWLTGALFGYPFWTSFCLHLLDGEEFGEDSDDEAAVYEPPK